MVLGSEGPASSMGCFKKEERLHWLDKEMILSRIANATAGECPIDARSFATLREISGIRAGNQGKRAKALRIALLLPPQRNIAGRIGHLEPQRATCAA